MVIFNSYVKLPEGISPIRSGAAEVWPGLKEYLRLALPCVAMMAMEWWAFATRKGWEFDQWFFTPKKDTTDI